MEFEVCPVSETTGEETAPCITSEMDFSVDVVDGDIGVAFNKLKNLIDGYTVLLSKDGHIVTVREKLPVTCPIGLFMDDHLKRYCGPKTEIKCVEIRGGWELEESFLGTFTSKYVPAGIECREVRIKTEE